MTALVIDGRQVAQDVLDDVDRRVQVLKGDSVYPSLTFVSIGRSAPAEMYVSRLQKLGKRHGVDVHRHDLVVDVTVADLEHAVVALGCDPEVDGILVQMPLPPHLEGARLSTLIEPRKDIDGITVHNAGCLYLGLPGQVPSTAVAMVQMVEATGISIGGKHAVVVGRSNVVGHPVAELLLHRDATVTVSHRQSRNLGQLTCQADILMVAAGEAGLIGRRMVKDGAVVVDAGINVTDGGVVGDVDFEACCAVASAISPVPGGVGPVTNAILLRHAVASAEARRA